MGLVWILSLTSVIVLPVVTAGVVAAVAGPLVSWMARRRVPRAVGAILVLLLIVAAGGLATYLILAGVTSEASAISHQLKESVEEIERALSELGIDDGAASSAGADLSSGATSSFRALVGGVLGGVQKLSSLVFFLAMTILSLVFCSGCRWLARSRS